MSVPSIALIVALTGGCSLMLETVHVQPRPDVPAVDAVGFDAGTDREAVDATGDDGSHDVLRFDHILPADVPEADAAIDTPSPDARLIDGTFVDIAPVDDVLLLDRTERPDFGLVSDVIASLDGGSVESGPPRDVIASLDAIDVNTSRDALDDADAFDALAARDTSLGRDALLDVHITCCGMAVPPTRAPSRRPAPRSRSPSQPPRPLPKRSRAATTPIATRSSPTACAARTRPSGHRARPRTARSDSPRRAARDPSSAR